MRESSLTGRIRELPGRPLAGFWPCALGAGLLGLLFLVPAFWNGFPLIFYDTGAYVLEGLGGVFLVERAPVYAELLFLAGGRFSLWPIVALQAAMLAYVILEVARAEVPGLTLRGLLGIGLALALLTGIGWYAGQVEPDVFTSVVILGSWLLLFREVRLGRARARWITGITGLGVACHPSHLGLIGGLLICALLLKFARRWVPALPSPRLRAGLTGLATALAMMVAGNFVLTGNIFLSKSGSVFVFARLMQDGIVKKLMDETCPPRGDAGWRLCEYKNRLKTRADAWLWGNSGFRALGGFTGKQQQDEDQRIILETLKRYPFLNIRMAVYDSVIQFLTFRTGDGIEPQEWVLESGFKRMIPSQLHAYLGARQQRGLIRFKTLNLIHVPIGVLSLLGLFLLLHHAAARGRWMEGALPGLVLLGLVGNAVICGTFSNPHDRYQSRVVWLPTLCLLLAVARDRRALQTVPGSEA